jgi:hypothetical protein
MIKPKQQPPNHTMRARGRRGARPKQGDARREDRSREITISEAMWGRRSFFFLLLYIIKLSDRFPAFTKRQHAREAACFDRGAVFDRTEGSIVHSGRPPSTQRIDYFAVFFIYCSPRCEGKQWKRTCIAQVAGTKELVALT